VKLVLFDLDGTLLTSDGAGRRAIQRALVERFGAAGPEDHWFDGKTDPQIVRELMQLAGVDGMRVEAEMGRVLVRYVECLHEELRAIGKAPSALPGVLPLLDALQVRDDVVLGVLTGNVQPGAHAKLTAVGIDPVRFRVGAFGSDHAERSQLPAIAQRRARELLTYEVAGGDMVIIGDTPADLLCGLEVGAHAVGVATGRYSANDLGAYRALAVFSDLTNTEAVVAAIMGS
jgi:phosphoglycolate phosphatase-like HAD superfamily hydrolase